MQKRGSSNRNDVTRFFTGMFGSRRWIAAEGSGPATSANTGLFFAGTLGSRAEAATRCAGNFTFNGMPVRFALFGRLYHLGWEEDAMSSARELQDCVQRLTRSWAWRSSK